MSRGPNEGAPPDARGGFDAESPPDDGNARDDGNAPAAGDAGGAEGAPEAASGGDDGDRPDNRSFLRRSVATISRGRPRTGPGTVGGTTGRSDGAAAGAGGRGESGRTAGSADRTATGTRGAHGTGARTGPAGAEEDAAGTSGESLAPVDHRTAHWTGVEAIPLVMVGVGVLLGVPGLVVAGVAGAALAGYAWLSAPPAVETASGEPAVAIERELRGGRPRVGDTVEVVVTVTNEGDGLLPDCRIVDGVPGELPVTEGSPRHATALRPGATDRFRYAVRAARGEHSWEPAHVVLADPGGNVERECRLGSPSGFTCRVTLDASGDLPLAAVTSPLPGRVDTDSGGAGLEFYAAREYQRGDPRSRIDWHRLASTGELGTIQYRRERSVSAVVLVDARRAAYCGPGDRFPNAVERSVDAAGRLLDGLLEDGNSAGVAVLGREDVWLPPGAGREHRARATALLSEHDALAPAPPEEARYARMLPERRETLSRRRVEGIAARLPPDAQLIALSPCVDEYPIEVVERVRADGHAVTVIGPDPTAERGPGHRLVAAERDDRLRALRATGARTVDWAADETLAAALGRADGRWTEVTGGG